MRNTIRKPARFRVMSFAVSVGMSAWAAAEQGVAPTVGDQAAGAVDVPINPAMLREISGAILQAERFENAEQTTDGLWGKAFKLQASGKYPRFPADRLNRSCGTLAWWVRYHSEILEPLYGLLNADTGQLYVNYCGKNAGDFRHVHRAGQFWAASMGLGGADFHPGGIKPGVWSFLAVTWNGNILEVYHQGRRSGVLRGAGPFTAVQFKEFVFGNIYTANKYDADFDEARAYNRALTSDEFAQLYAAATRGGEEVKRLAFAIPATPASRETAALRAAYWLSDHTVRVYAGLSSVSKEPLDVCLTLLSSGGKEIAAQRWNAVDPAKPFAATLDPGASLPSGHYVVRMQAAGRTQEARLTRVCEEWEDNTIGVSDEPPAPWTPVVAKRSALACWGRTYTLSGLGLPSSIRAMQPEPAHGRGTAELLHSPVRLLYSNGTEHAFEKGQWEVTGRTDAQIKVRGAARAGGLKAQLVGTLDYDGFYRMDLIFTPSAEACAASELRLEIPVPDSQALLFNAAAVNMRADKVFLDISGMEDGELWTSMNGKTVSRNSGNEQTLLPYETDPYWAQLWLGNDDRGLAVTIDDDRGWRLDPKVPKLRLVRKNGRTVLNVRFINTPTKITAPFSVSLAMQATPIRPRPKGGSWRKEFDGGWGFFDEPVIWHEFFKAKAPKTPWWRYACLQSHRVKGDDKTFGPMVRRTEDEWAEGGNYTTSHLEFLMWVAKEWHEKKGLAGYYFDNTMPRRGWVYSQREYLKRLRTYFTQVGKAPVLKAHMTDAPMIGTLGFADWWMDGENAGYVPESAKAGELFDFVDRWGSRTGLVNLRITLGRQWGTMPHYLYWWGRDATEAVLGLFDLRYGTVMARKSPYAFGWDEVDREYVPYWDARQMARIAKGGPDVHGTVWKRPGRARLMVSNLSEENRDVTVKLDLKQLGLSADAVATDEQTFEGIPIEHGVISDLDVNRHNYRLVLLGKPGEFPPVENTHGRALMPKTVLFQDDFSVLRPDWRVIFDEGFLDGHGRPQKTFVNANAGHLRITFNSGTYAAVYRPLPEDYCSVMVNIRQSTSDYNVHFGGFRPMLGLYWDESRYVRILSGLEGANTFAEGSSDGKQNFSKIGEMSGLMNWVKSSLQSDKIVFQYSTDGLAWKPLHTQSRAGFEGKPNYVFLGHGGPGRVPLFQNSAGRWSYHFYSYFDDCVIGREE